MLISVFTPQAFVRRGTCSEISVFASTTATTSYGIPEPVMDARVVNDTNSTDCVVEWGHVDMELDFVTYAVCSPLY